ncbi:hypothetical protein FB45DRAFT_1051062 [Roridomyces roridus]|uniref:Uncharacterized protein n=1 Tax=Roridomyces roridus TaxID=1738132 RepID=A0AAD7CNG3_9AGAR|nr:hypothetical protein FB45DRAFT_1051062 [Roridomyces roridus]
MPTINSTEEAYSAGITLAGHVYSKAAVHHFIRSLAIVLAFILFSYLALVTFPSLAARKYPSPPALRNDSPRIDSGPRDRSVLAHIRLLWSTPLGVTAFEILASSPTAIRYDDPTRTRPTPARLRCARVPPLHRRHARWRPPLRRFLHLAVHPCPPERKIVFPWVHPDASFGLVRSGFSGSGLAVRKPIRAAALCKPKSVAGGRERERGKIETADSTDSSTTTSHSTSQPTPVAPRNKNRMRDSRLLYKNFGSSSNKVNIKTRRRSKNLMIKTEVSTTMSNAHAAVKSASAGHGKNVKRAHRVGVIFEGRGREREGEKENVGIELREVRTGV